MVRYAAKVKVKQPEDMPLLPRKTPPGQNFWCSFNTRKQLIMCSVIYRGEDELMQQEKWYDCIIELPYGEKFPPLGDEFSESIDLTQSYLLNVAEWIIGECILLERVEIVYGSFDIRKDEFGNY